MEFSAQQVCDLLADLLVDSCNTDRHFSRVDGNQNFQSNSLIFIAADNGLDHLQSNIPAVVVTTPELFLQLKATKAATALLAVSNVRLAQAIIKQAFADYCASDPEWEQLHSSAVIHPSASIASNVRIGPNSVIGANVVIADGCQIRANCVIEHNVTIGKDSVIHNLVNISYGCQLGERVIVRPGAIIGNEGFGLAQDEQRHYHRIPHTGSVTIGDDVQIGANCNIDRGTYGATRIARGVKLDALCHIAHNVVINKHSLFAAQSVVAGSSTIGKHVIASGQTGVLDHTSIADEAVLVHRCGATEDIPHSGMWAGTPARPFKEYVRNLRLEKKVAKLERQIKQLQLGGGSDKPEL